MSHPWASGYFVQSACPRERALKPERGAGSAAAAERSGAALIRTSSMACGQMALEAAGLLAGFTFGAGHALARAVVRRLSSQVEACRHSGWDPRLTTVGAKTGQKRQSTVARFRDGEDAWLVVASAGGSAHHPAWYHNIAAHPDQVWIEFGGRQLRVTPPGSTETHTRKHGSESPNSSHATPGMNRNRPRHPRHPALPR